MDRIKILTEYRQELVAEEKRLRKLLSQIEDQMHVLQIEQFHLSGLRIRTTEEIEDENGLENADESKKSTNFEELDLNVDRKKISNEEEEEEEEDDEEDEEMQVYDARK